MAATDFFSRISAAVKARASFAPATKKTSSLGLNRVSFVFSPETPSQGDIA